MKLDLASTAFLAQLASLGAPGFHEMEPEEARLAGGQISESFPPGPDMASVRDETITGSDGVGFRVRVLSPTKSPRAAIVFYHGGGWVLGDIDQYDTLGRQLAKRTGAAVVLVDYRKAPEHRYPAAAHDAYDALTWVDGNIASIAGKRVPIIVAGDSAGGNLAAVVAQRAKAENGPDISLQLLVYPVTDGAMNTPGYANPDNQLLLNTPLMEWFWDHYAPNKEDREEPGASPARAKDLSGLPPALVVTAEYDVLRDEAEAYGEAMRAAGVPVTIKRFDRQMHNFFAMPGLLPAAATALEYVGQQIDRHLATSSEVDAVIVGAGFAGMYQLHKLRQQGLSTRVIERADDVGGTWYWNRYPGARVDIESMAYSFSFDEELEQEWTWKEKYSPQPEILSYAQHVADRFDLRRDITFETSVTRALYNEDTARWNVYTDTGEVISAQFLIMATGCLSAIKTPDIPGADTFTGETYITGLWPHEGVDFSGKRVAVIGTGSSAIQAIPHIAEQADQLTVHQRTPAYSMPAFNRPLEETEIQQMKTTYRDYREAQRNHLAGIPYPERNLMPAAAEGDNERKARLETAWESGILTALTSSYMDVLSNQDANDLVSEFVRDKIRARVKDPETAETLAPKTYPLGTKRPCLDTNYYETYNRDNVRLVDLHKTPIQEITPTGVRTTSGEDSYDAIVFATGFDAMTGALERIDIRGVDDMALKDKWADGPHTYLGLSVAGFPNLFTITGPSSPSVLSNMIVSIEQHVDWISDCIAWMRDKGHTTIEPTEKAETEWAIHNEQAANLTLFPQANSWYIGANVPGKPRTFMAYIGGVDVYRHICDAIASDNYQGFETA
ncbi:alpha/beta hydrolase fold domain-containing protein [Pyruvatibacter sp.]|uniref:alpha/beta hydrolase fold domain-containing protein n=1 Tax=Pyruvatibacter sp. TaxID=1981328 RepID=UPI0032647C47